MDCVVPENIHTPPPPHGWLMEIPRGLGGTGVQGVPTRIIFHSVVKDAIDHTRQT